MARKTGLEKVAQEQSKASVHGIIKLLMADHKLLRTLMKEVTSHKKTDQQVIKAFRELEKTVISHVTAEERTFYDLIKSNAKFEHASLEGYEEHRIHEYILSGIRKVKDVPRKVQQMRSFCEVLEHHLDEEEEEIFPRFKKYVALSTRKKIGKKYLKVRKKTNTTKKKRGAARFES